MQEVSGSIPLGSTNKVTAPFEANAPLGDAAIWARCFDDGRAVVAVMTRYARPKTPKTPKR